MELAAGLFVYLIIVIFSSILIRRQGIVNASAIMISLIIGQIILNLLIPAANLNPMSDSAQTFDSFSAIYIVIQLLTPIIIYIYTVYMGIKDRG